MREQISTQKVVSDEGYSLPKVVTIVGVAAACASLPLAYRMLYKKAKPKAPKIQKIHKIWIGSTTNITSCRL